MYHGIFILADEVQWQIFILEKVHEQNFVYGMCYLVQTD